MRTTGIVRRIDELGRVVIPKEIRKAMHIKEGEELEVFVEGEDKLVLKKYSVLESFSDLSKKYTEILRKYTSCVSLICDTDKCISSGSDREKYEGKRITKTAENFLKQRKSAILRGGDVFPIIIGAEYKEMIIAPIIAAGDIVGGIALLNKQSFGDSDNMLKITELTADFFAKQIE